MKYILDTHILLWWLDDPEIIDEKARSIIGNGANNIYVSATTVWEIVLKKSLGKLQVPGNLAEAIEQNRFSSLSICPEHAYELEALPDIHRDPFDRILVAQAIYEQSIVITRDSRIMEYDIEYVQG